SAATKEPLLVIVVALVILIQTKVFGGTMGTILISLLFFYRALNSLVFTQLHWNAFMSVSGSMENMKDFQNILESNQETKGTIPFVRFEDSIKIDNANFSYGDFKILKDINLAIHKNQSIAF